MPSSRQPILQDAGFALGHLRVEEAKGSASCGVWVKRFTEGTMPGPAHGCTLPFPPRFSSRERIASALLPSLSHVIVLFSLALTPDEGRTRMTSHDFHSPLCCHHVTATGRCPINIKNNRVPFLKTTPGNHLS